MTSFIEKIAQLRASMKDKNIDALIIPSTDPHLGENIPDYWRTITWLTGFTGSAATVIITDSFAGLWTDSRYFLQAEKQLAGSGFAFMNTIAQERKDYIEWLADNVKPDCKISIDGRLMPVETIRKIEKSLTGKNVTFDTDCDLISELWSDRPQVSVSPAFDHNVKFCGRERAAKIAEVRDQMRKQDIDYHFLSSVDDINWLLNIRGNDYKYSPLVASFAIVADEQILLFVDESKIPLKLAMEFDKLDIVILPYEETEAILSSLHSESRILINTTTTSVSIFYSIPQGMEIKEDISIPARLKSIKNKIEIENICNAMVKDGIALTKFFYWLEQNIDEYKISEISVSEKLEDLRSEQEYYLGPSFPTIAAWNEHGALPHYSATSESDYLIENKGILLVDSGGQYLDGTTDITRTISVGQPTSGQKRDFTLVLKGVINLAMAKFPTRTRGYQLDLLARKSLWEHGFNYGHGTGHGVGFCLNVHEGPQNIGPISGTDSKTFIEAGMLISDEPAIYREGEYGIRIENLILCYEDEETEFGKFLKFDTVSLCYIDKSLIDISLLELKELEWLNSYHSEVYNKLSLFLTENEKIWLKEKTSSL